MRFSDLRPTLRALPRSGGQFVTLQNAWGFEFDCPQCKRDGRTERVYVPLHGAQTWQISPDSTGFDDVTLTPSVRMNPGFHCLGHWNITCGEIVFHGDSCSGRVRIRLPTELKHHHHER